MTKEVDDNERIVTDTLITAKIVTKVIFTIQSIGISILLIVAMWKENALNCSYAENVLITIWISLSLVSLIAYYAIWLYKRIKQEED